MKDKLSIRQAFDVMTHFLTVYWEKTNSDDIANLLSDMNTEVWLDGSTADPAIWDDWLDAVSSVPSVKQGDSLTVLQAFKAMKNFLENYLPFNPRSNEVALLIGGIQLGENDMPVDPAVWNHWLDSTFVVLKT